jgi:hypothetical protein
MGHRVLLMGFLPEVCPWHGSITLRRPQAAAAGKPGGRAWVRERRSPEYPTASPIGVARELAILPAY